MKRCALLVCLLALASLVAGQDSTPDTQIGNYLFRMPNGWNPRGERRGHIHHVPFAASRHHHVHHAASRRSRF